MSLILWASLLLLAVCAEAQSGDKEADHDIFCTSNISMNARNSITCNTVGNNDNEDDEDACGGIANMTVCFIDNTKNEYTCIKEQGNTVTSEALDVINSKYSLTASSYKGCTFKKTLNLRKIVKPNPPWLKNVTFNQRSKTAVIHIANPYEKDYLQHSNQLFQLSIFSEKHALIENTTEVIFPIEGEYLRGNTDYTVKVRAIPQGYFEGTWSEWSSPRGFSSKTDVQEQEQERYDWFFWILCAIAILLIAWTGYQRKKIHAYICPSIPHPKHNLLQICKPIKGPVMSFNSEVFRDPNIHLVYTVVEQQPLEEKPPEPTAPPWESPRSTLACSTADTSYTTTISSNSSTTSSRDDSVSTLLSRSYPGADPLPKSWGASPAGSLWMPEGSNLSRTEEGSNPDVNGAAPPAKEEAYVTMCSFYQIK